MKPNLPNLVSIVACCCLGSCANHDSSRAMATTAASAGKELSAAKELTSGKELSANKGYALSIGLNYVSSRAYGNDGKLKGCVSDATDMRNIAAAQGFETAPLLLNEDATKKNVETAIRKASRQLKKGDTFVLSYSGHGGQVFDTNGDERDDYRDETWCLYDGQMPDDKLAQLWSEFESGVRILVFSDSCHSGTVIKHNRNGTLDKEFDPLAKTLPPEVLEELRNRPENRQLDAGLPNEEVSKGNTSAAVVLISACQDQQVAKDGTRNGRFTGALRDVWGDATFSGSLKEFQKAINRKVNDEKQRPAFDRVGNLDSTFEAQRPWTK